MSDECPIQLVSKTRSQSVYRKRFTKLFCCVWKGHEKKSKKKWTLPLNETSAQLKVHRLRLNEVSSILSREMFGLVAACALFETSDDLFVTAPIGDEGMAWYS